MSNNPTPRPARTVTEIADGIFDINDYNVTDCYVITGDEKALLIDVGTGFGGLKETVGKITDLPLTVVATHSHTDHLGGKGEFENIYVHKKDITQFTGFMTSVPIRRAMFLGSKGNVESFVKMKDIKKGDCHTRLLPLEDKGSFDLGGRTVKYKHLPGHTKGSIVLWDDKTHIFFAGDNVCAQPWLFLAHATSVEEWLDTAREIYRLADDYLIYWSHEGGKLEKSLIGRVIEIGEEVLRKYPRNRILPKIVFYPTNDRKNGSLAFRASNIHKK